MLSLSLFADGGKAAGSPLDRPDLIYGTAGLAGALLVGAVAVYVVDRWRKRAATADRMEVGTELTGFRAMYERGEITEAEYVRLREKVAARVKPAPAAGGAAPPPAGAISPPPPPAGGPLLTGPLPADYFDDPELSDQPLPPPPGGKPAGPPPPGPPA